jgi:catalase
VYAPNSFGGPQADAERYGDPSYHIEGELLRNAYKAHREDDDFGQPGTAPPVTSDPTTGVD